MRILGLMLLSMLLAACSVERSESTFSSGDDLSASLSGKRLMFLGAHPDDEWVLMPILAEACLFNDATCHFISVTFAEWGCFETSGETDLDACAERRTREFAASAAIANGATEILDWEDLFYAHSGAGLRRNLQRWAEVEGGRDALITQLVEILERENPDVIFGLDPRHGATCNPNHRAASLLLIDAVDQLDAREAPRVLFENTFAVLERMTPEMAEASDGGAMFPWPDRDDPILFFDANKTLPNGRRAIEYQIDSLRAHGSQFPELPDDIEITTEPSQLRIPLVDLKQIDPTIELCTPLDLTGYKTVDVTLEFVARRIKASAEAEERVLAVQLRQGENMILEYGVFDAAPYSAEIDFAKRDVSLRVAAASQEMVDAAVVSYSRLVKRFADAPE